MQESEMVFAFGSNMDPDQMRERCPESDLSWFAAEARGWELWFPRKSDKRKGGVGSIRKKENSTVWGVVFLVTPRDRMRLDCFEGVQEKNYRHERIDVVDKNGISHSVLAYVAVPAEPPQEYKPHKDYLRLYLRGAGYFGLPSEYIKKLREIETVKTESQSNG